MRSRPGRDRKSTRLNSSHSQISYAVFCLKKTLLHLQDSLGALILIYPTMTIPFCTWLVMGFLRSVPWQIEEQTMIDGYSGLAVILRVAPRLIVPGILTVIVFTFTLVLQEFVYA